MKFVILCLLVLSNLSASTDSFIHSLYKDPSHSNFVELSHSWNDIHIKSDNQDALHALNLMGIFIGHALTLYPEYVSSYIDSFETLLFNEQLGLLKGLQFANTKHPLLEQIENPKYQPFFSNSPAIEISKLKTHDPQIADELDYLWVSFFATGDPQYIQKILEFINSNPKALFYAFVTLNQELFDSFPKKLQKIEQNLQNAFRQDKEFIHDYLMISTGLWSLDSNMTQDETIKTIVKELINENPNLNYLAKLGKMLSEDLATL